MSVLDFLFEGQPPAGVTQYGQSTEQIPKWLSDYTQGLIARANAIAAEPYQAYEGPRLAGFSPDQLAAFEATRQSVGIADPYISQAAQGALAGMTTDPLASASPFMQQAAQTFPGAVQDYMNPYVQNVLDRQEAMATRTLEEQFLPQLQEAFVGSGQFGSERMLELGQQGVRDISEGLEQQRLATLADAYGQSADIFAQDQARQAQLAGTAGQLATAAGQLGLQGAGQLGALGQLASQQALQDAAALEAIGAQQQQFGQQNLDLAYQDFLTQRDYPREQVNWLSSVIRGIPYGTTTTTQTTGPAQTYQPSPISQLGALASAYQGFQNWWE